MPVKRSGKQDHTTTNGTTGAMDLSFFVFPGLRCKATEATLPGPTFVPAAAESVGG